MKSIKFLKNPSIIFGALITLLMVSSSFIQTATDPLAAWDKAILKQANTGASATYLSDDEKKLIFYNNLCRLKPKLFCQTVLADYVKTHTTKPDLVASLQTQLNQDNALSVLVTDQQLCTIAHDFAKKMGEEGKQGHPDFQSRMQPVMDRYNRVGENCDYGNKSPLDAYMHLLIDSSDPVNLQHRKNFLDPKLQAIGVALQPHKTFQWNWVMDFGGN
jgi:uncharacterized protein YkwD